MAFLQLDSPIRLEIPSDPRALSVVRAFVTKLCSQMGFEAVEAERIVLCVDEACTNIIRHAYGGRIDELITLTFEALPEALEIAIRDFGQPVDPASFQSRDAGDLRPGGLGLRFMRAAVDRLSYESDPQGGTLLKLTKSRNMENAHREDNRL